MTRPHQHCGLAVVVVDLDGTTWTRSKHYNRRPADRAFAEAVAERGEAARIQLVVLESGRVLREWMR